jgi:hypothetical protein
MWCLTSIKDSSKVQKQLHLRDTGCLQQAEPRRMYHAYKDSFLTPQALTKPGYHLRRPIGSQTLLLFCTNPKKKRSSPVSNSASILACFPQKANSTDAHLFIGAGALAGTTYGA